MVVDHDQDYYYVEPLTREVDSDASLGTGWTTTPDAPEEEEADEEGQKDEGGDAAEYPDGHVLGPVHGLRER